MPAPFGGGGGVIETDPPDPGPGGIAGAPFVTELAEILATEMGEPYGDLDVANQFNLWVIDAVRSFCEEADWTFLQYAATLLTVAGTATYELPADFGYLRAFIGPTGERLSFRTLDDLVRQGAVLTTSGAPHTVYMAGMAPDSLQQQLGLFPVPASELQHVLYYQRVLSLAETDQIILPRDVIAAIKYAVRVAYHTNATDGDPGKAQFFGAAYQSEIQRLRTRYTLPPALDARTRFGDLDNAPSLYPYRLPNTIG